MKISFEMLRFGLVKSCVDFILIKRILGSAASVKSLLLFALSLLLFVEEYVRITLRALSVEF